MLFNSFEFIFFFLPVVLIVYFALPSHRLKLIWLLLASYFFYGYWNYKFIPLLLLSTSLDFYLGLKMADTEDPRRRKQLLLLTLVSNLGLLGYFKYAVFFTDNFFVLTSLINSDWRKSFTLDIVLPVGISFYTFQSMSYTIDIYLRQTKPHRDFVAFATYVALYPQLIAGPIVRHSELVFQLENPSRFRFDAKAFALGLVLFTLGLAKKVILADRLAAAVDPALLNLSLLSTAEAWLSILGYTLQIYFDFSGYSDMAIGLGSMLGFSFPKNFDSPYKSKSITEFWQRWHISLSSWLRDYLYIPLGGNRHGKLKTYRNLMLTMLLGGFWHGASWVYVIWGGFHGLCLAAERGLRADRRRWLPNLPKQILTFWLVMMGWIAFRSLDVNMMLTWLERLYLPPYDFDIYNIDPKVRDKFFPVLIFGLWLTFKGRNTGEINWERLIHSPRWAFALAALFVLTLLFVSKDSPFLYFQF